MIGLSLGDITVSIQLAIAPIFLLVGTGSLLNVVTTRLGRIIDRARILEQAVEAGEDAVLEERHVMELNVLDKRMRFGNRAVLFSTISAVLICLLVILIFLLDLLGLPAAALIVVVLFAGAMASLSIGLISFLIEVSIATRVLRVRHELLARLRIVQEEAG